MAPAPPRPELSPSAVSGRPRILVADDDPAMRDLLREVLARDGYVVTTASDGLELLDRLSTGTTDFELVVSDVRMPFLSAIDVLAMTPREPRPLFVVVTGFVEANVIPMALGLGASAVLGKPFEMRELRLVVRTLLDGRRAQTP